MRKASFRKYQLSFKSPVLTSRGEMKVKNGYYLFISDGNITGVGECSFIKGLSVDDLVSYETALQSLCRFIEAKDEALLPDLAKFPSIRFGWETARLDFVNGGKKILFESEFTQGRKQIPINGLVWMGSKDFMQQQIGEKLAAGFRCIKIKVGAIDFEEELTLLKFIRSKFPAEVVEIRLDANGAFKVNDVFEKLERLSRFQIHSIEQPVKPGQLELMAKVCKGSPILVALDEELIGVPENRMMELLSGIQPAFIILKPSMLGGIQKCEQWINAAKENEIGWWATSALESNIGLNAIAQWVFVKDNPLKQGLGTGGLYTENVPSPLYIANGDLGFNPKEKWGIL